MREDVPVTLREIREVANHAIAFVVDRPEGMEFAPGQHLFVELPGGEGHPFSIVSAPEEDVFEFATVLRDGSDFKQALGRKAEGDELILSGPYGRFTPCESSGPVGLLAGGIGVTPFLSVLRHIARKGGTDAVLLHSAKSAGRTPYREELNRLDEESGIGVILTLTRESWDGPQGRIDADFVRKHVDDARDRAWFIAGPPAFVEAMNGVLREGVGVENVELDAFEGY